MKLRLPAPQVGPPVGELGPGERRARRAGGCATSRAGTRGSRAGPRRPIADPRRPGSSAHCSASRSKRIRQAEKRFSWSPGSALLEAEQVRDAAARPSCRSSRSGRWRSIVSRSFSPRRRRRPRPRRCRSACAPSRRAPSRRRPRRRTGSGRGARRRRSARPSMYFSNSHASRDLPMPAMPVTETSCARRVLGRRVEQLLDEPELAVAADERRLEAGRPLRRRAPRRRREARARAKTGSALPFSSCRPASS